MVDERMQSTVMWLNSPYRSKQDVATLQDHIKIRQFHHYNWDDVWPLFPQPSLSHTHCLWYNLTSLHQKCHISRSSVGTTWRLRFKENGMISHFLGAVYHIHSSHSSWIQWPTWPVTSPSPKLMGYLGWTSATVLLKNFATLKGTDLNLMSATELIFDRPGFEISFLPNPLSCNLLYSFLTFRLPHRRHRLSPAPLLGRNGSKIALFLWCI